MLRPWLTWQALLAVSAVLPVCGCAGGAWLESPSEGELPLEAPPAAVYPTAVEMRRPATASLSDEPDESATPNLRIETPEATEPASTPAVDPAKADESAAAADQKPPSHPSPPVTPLAVVPPHLRAAAASKASPATSNASPAAAEPAPDAPTTPIPAATTPATPLAPVATPAELAGPSEGAASAAAATPPAAAPVEAARTEAAPAEGSENAQPEDETSEARQARLDKVRSELIAAFEAEIQARREANANDEELPRLEQQLRLAYLVDERLDEAVTPIDSLDDAQREAYKHLMFSAGVWLSPDEARRPPLRSAKALRSLREATTALSAASKLELRNLVFCEKVEYFGWYTEFPRNEFRPKQQVVLYVEVDNFSAEDKGPQGFETELQGSYQIFDSRGQIVAERQLPLDRELCRNYRRDYFLAYLIYLPDGMAPGRYRLELTVEDLKSKSAYQGRKLGEGMIEFTIRQ